MESWMIFYSVCESSSSFRLKLCPLNMENQKVGPTLIIHIEFYIRRIYPSKHPLESNSTREIPRIIVTGADNSKPPCTIISRRHPSPDIRLKVRTSLACRQKLIINRILCRDYAITEREIRRRAAQWGKCGIFPRHQSNGLGNELLLPLKFKLLYQQIDSRLADFGHCHFLFLPKLIAFWCERKKCQSDPYFMIRHKKKASPVRQTENAYA